MSRVGKYPVEIPAGVQVMLAGRTLTAKGKVLQMQTAFNPNLPGAGEGVRTFTKSIKHMSGGSLVIKMVEPGRVVPTPDMLDAVISGDLEAAFTWSGYAASKAAVFQLFGTVPFGPGPLPIVPPDSTLPPGLP